MTLLRAQDMAWLRPICGAALLMTMAGCMVGPNYKRPAAPAPPAYKENGGTTSTVPPPPDLPGGQWKPVQPSDQAIRGKWWENYGDSGLNSLEEKVSVSNQTLKAAEQQYIQARAALQQVRSNLFPTFNLGTADSRNHVSSNRPVSSALSKTQYNDFVITGQAAWEPDFWGQIRRSVESSRSTAQATAADLANVELSLRSELALDYFQLRGLDTQKQLLDATVVSFQRYYDLTVTRFKGGVSTQSDVELADTQLQTTRAQAIDVTVARAQFEHAIATLIGEPASSFSLPPAPLDLPLPQLPVGMPSELLERRPDIAGFERRMQAANAQIGVARAAYFPNVNLNGAGGVESLALGTLIQGPSTLWSVGGSAAETVFDAGRRRAATQQAQAAYDATVANYRESVLNAFQEVEDNLAALRILQDEAITEQTAVAAAQRSLNLSTSRYKDGVTTYLEVLTAQTALLTNQRTAADITTRQFSANVQLIKALGGGWDQTQLPKL
jgi:NodT family efflux transporter outer membrane factor (OMF) lipoprotein